MRDIHTQVQSLKRPPLLVRAARFGVDEYRRDQHLRRSLSYDRIPRSGYALIRLLETERVMNDSRIAKHGDYMIAKHVDILVAIMGEAQLLRSTTRPALVAQRAP
jgi:hypothetical protein